MRRRTSSIAANPTLIGAATVLVVVVALFLSYNANTGLPFVPTYQIKSEVPNAGNLVIGNEIRLGGTRIGTVSDITPKRYGNGRVTAVLTLKLDQIVRPLPDDSTVLVRPRSALGLKYLQIARGNSRSDLPAGGTLALSQATPRPVELDEVITTFDEQTRKAIVANTNYFGNGLAGRGGDLNEAIQSFGPLLTVLQPVAQNLSDPRTELGQTIRSLQRTASEVAPVAETQGDLIRNLDTTFRALDEVARPFIQQTISEGVPLQRTLQADLPRIRPFLAETGDLLTELRPGARALRRGAPNIADALDRGTTTVRRLPQLTSRLRPTLRTLEAFSQDPLVNLGLQRTQRAVDLLRPTVRNLKPAQTVCNYVGLFFRNVPNLLSEGNGLGTWQRISIIITPEGPNNETLAIASRPANGPGESNHLHANPYPNAAGPNRTQECEAGNEDYLVGRTVTGNVPGNQGTKTEATGRAAEKEAAGQSPATDPLAGER